MLFLKECNFKQTKLSGSGKHFIGLSCNTRTTKWIAFKNLVFFLERKDF